MKQNFTLATAILIILTSAFALASHAEDAPTGAQKVQPAQQADTDTTTRVKALEGSPSRWSGQFQLYYSGAPLSDPFGSNAPNPGGQSPPPFVSLQALGSFRYRLDDTTTMGTGIGMVTYRPFQNPSGTTVDNPTVDIAKSFQLGPFHSRADLQVTFWTNHEYYHDFGYRYGFEASDEITYRTKSPVDFGLEVSTGYNLFAQGNFSSQQLGNQYIWNLFLDPYIEYRFNKEFNLRSAWGITFQHNELNPNGSYWKDPDVYQGIGLGYSATSAVYLYAYITIESYVVPFTSNNIGTGLSAIINLF